MKGEIFEDFNTCPYSEQTYYEYDTGYSEYGCTLGDNNPEENPCYCEQCPLNCTYEVTED